MKINEIAEEFFPSVETPNLEKILKIHRKHKKHRSISLGFLKNQLKKGIKIELEHTENEAMAKEIALDHLAEKPDYYRELEKIEEGPKWDSVKLFYRLFKKGNKINKLKKDSQNFWNNLIDAELPIDEQLRKVAQFQDSYDFHTKSLRNEIKELEQITVKQGFLKTRRVALNILKVLSMIDNVNEEIIIQFQRNTSLDQLINHVEKLLANIPDIEEDDIKNESAMGGSTSAGNIASIASPLRGIQRRGSPSLFGYVEAKPKKKKKKKKKKK